MAANHRKTMMKFALCVATDDADLLTPRMVYQVLPDDSAARSGYLRVIDNEGEDYLYPASYFILVDFPPAVGRALLRAGGPAGANPPRERVTSTRKGSLQAT